MYKLLIVEDEEIERNSLKSMIASFHLDIKEIAVAENGEQGFALYKAMKPDIILADIDMPKLDGLAMIEKIRKEDTHTICLILTSYDDFAYAQKAIRLNVEDFILKPADKETLVSAMIKAIEQLCKSKNTYVQTSSLVKKINLLKPLLESECFYAILTKKDEKSLINIFKINGIDVGSGLCFIFEKREGITHLITAFRKDIEESGYVCIQGNIDNKIVIFVVANRYMNEEDSHFLNVALHLHQLDHYHFAMGKLKEDAMDLYASYEEAMHHLNNVNHHVEIDFTVDEKSHVASFAISWANLLIDEIDHDNSQLISEFCHQLVCYDNVKINEIMHLLVEQMKKEIKEKYAIEISIEEIHHSMIEKSSYQNLELVVMQILQRMLKPIRNIKFQNGSYLMKKAMKYINENYKKAINLNDLAAELNVSSFYISKLFRKELDLNFTEVVNNLRIKEAKRLIKHDYSFKEVSFLVGFGSQSYFSKIFKKKVGMSPKEYRNMF